MLRNLIARIVIGGGGSRLWFCLAIAVVLCGCATPVESTEEKPGESEEPMVLDCSPESLGRLGSLDVAIAIDNSLSTQHPTGYDADGDGTVGVIKTAFTDRRDSSRVLTDRGDSWLGAQIAAVRPLIQNALAYDVRFSITTLSGQPFFSHRRRSTWAVGDRDARTLAAMTDDVAVLEKALDKIVRAGSDGSASFYAGMRRANQSLIESTDRDQKRRKIVLFISDAPGPLFRTSDGLIRGASARVAAATRDAKRNQIVFNTFGLTEKSPEWSDFSLSLIGSMTGGTYSAVEDPRELYCHLVDSLVIEDAVSSNDEKVILAGSLLGSSASTTLDFDNLPAESGLSGLTNDGHVAANWRSDVDGDGATNRGGESSATDNAPAITAAIDYACANGYDIVQLPAGIYRIGGDSGVNGTSWDGVRMDINACPHGVRLTGKGTDWEHGGTLLLNNQNHGGFMIELADLRGANDQNGGHIYGIGDGGSADNQYVTALALGGTTPVVTIETGGAGGRPVGFADGTEVFIRGCLGSVELNDKVWILDNGVTNGDEFDFDILDQEGNDYEPTGQVSAWVPHLNGANPDTSCVITHLNKSTVFEFDNFAYGTDAPLADMQWKTDTDDPPNVFVTSEEQHGLRIKISGGRVWVHDTLVIRSGDEAVDMASNETALIYENNVCRNSSSGCVVQQGSTGSIIRKNVFDLATTWINDSVDTGTTTEPSNLNGTAIQVGPVQPTCRRVANMLIEGNVFRGQYRGGIGLRTQTPHFPSQDSESTCTEVENVTIRNNEFVSQPRTGLCDEAAEQCIAILARADIDAPFINLSVTENRITGPVVSMGSGSQNWVWRDNIIVAHDNFKDTVGATLSAPDTHFIGNTVTGFEDACVTVADNFSDLVDFTATQSSGWDLTNEELDLGAAAGFQAGDRIKFSGGSTLPVELADYTFYWMEPGSAAGEFTFSATPREDSAYAVIALSGSPTGEFTVTVEHSQTAIEVAGNTLDCPSDSGSLGATIKSAIPGKVEPCRPETACFLKITGNEITLPADGYMRDAINIAYSPKNLEISGNNIFAPAPLAGTRKLGISVLATAADIGGNNIDGHFDDAAIKFSEGTNPSPAEGGPRGSTTVHNNRVNNNSEPGGIGIYAYMSRAPIIKDNVVTSTDLSGIMLWGGGDTNYGNAQITGNYISEMGTVGSKYGIESSCTGCTTMSGNIISNNVMDMGGRSNIDGMFLRSISDSLLQGNMCINMHGGNGECIWIFPPNTDGNLCQGNFSEEDTPGGAGGFICGDSGSTLVGPGCGSYAGSGANGICQDNQNQ